MAKLYPLFNRFTKFIAKDGKNMRFWEDCWCDNQTLKLCFPNLFVVSSRKEASVFQCWDMENNMWNLSLRRGLFNRELSSWIALVEKINDVRLISEPDMIRWQPKSSGVYSTKSMFQNLVGTTTRIGPSITNLIWNHKSPKMVKVFLWSWAYRSLKTDDRVQKKFKHWALSPSSCRLCLKEGEDLDHIFIHCEFAWKAWSFIARVLGISFCVPQESG